MRKHLGFLILLISVISVISDLKASSSSEDTICFEGEEIYTWTGKIQFFSSFRTQFIPVQVTYKRNLDELRVYTWNKRLKKFVPFKPGDNDVQDNQIVGDNNLYFKNQIEYRIYENKDLDLSIVHITIYDYPLSEDENESSVGRPKVILIGDLERSK